jgi:DNA-binding XRE family transcriptional regulator
MEDLPMKKTHSTKNTFQLQDFALRLATLRESKKISACAMSHALGHNRNYINGIELQRYLPSLTEFFEICSYLNISPSDFFNPQKQMRYHGDSSSFLQEESLSGLWAKMTPEQCDSVYQMIQEFLR